MSVSSSPIFSAIIPTYNRAEFLPRAIQSALEQRLADGSAPEVIVVDDESTDATPDVAASFRARIQYVRQANRREGAARNAGAANARGAYLAFLDSDDYWLPGKLAGDLARFEQADRPALVYSRGRNVDPLDRDLGGRRLATYQGDVFWQLAREAFMPMSSVAVRADAFRTCSGFVEDRDLSGTADWELWMRLAARWPVGFVDQTATCIRVHGRNMSADPRYMERAMLAGVRYALADPVVARRARGREAFIRACMYVTIALNAYANGRRAHAWLWLGRAFTTAPAQSVDPRFVGALARVVVGPRTLVGIRSLSRAQAMNVPEISATGRPSILFARNLFLPEDLGGNRYPYETIRRLGTRGHRVTVATPRLHAQFPPLDGVQYHLYPIWRPHAAVSHFTNLASATLALRGLPRHSVALAGSYDAALALGWAGLVPATPLVFLYHSEFYSEWVHARASVRRVMQRYMAAVERRVFALSARIVAVSEFSAMQIRSRLPDAADRVRVIPTGVDTDFFRRPDTSKAHVRAELGLDPTLPVILGVGRLAGVKQFDRLITAFAACSARGLAAQLVIAGGGPERPNLERLIATYGLGDRVLLAGYCDPPRLRAFMQAADLQVCTSAFENLSLAILEGMACGTPVLGSPGGGTPELVGQIDPALILADDHAHTLADALPGWLEDQDRLTALGERARKLAVEQYDWERVVDRLERACAEVARM